MTAITERVDLEALSAQAREVRFGRSVLSLVAWALIMFGRLLGFMWLVPVWCFLAVRTGWRDVHPVKESGVRRAG
jgi:hypothetical protein